MEPPQNLINIITFHSLQTSDYISILFIIILIFISALVSSSEVAFFLLNPSDIEDIKNENSNRSNKIIYLLRNPNDLLASILITNNLANISIAILSSSVINHFVDFGENNILYFVFNILIVTFILVFFGEVFPKVYAISNKMKLIRLMYNPYIFLKKIYYPLIFLLNKSSKLFLTQISSENNIIRDKDLEKALEFTDSKELDDDDKKILDGILKINDINVTQIMTSRIDIFSLNYKCNFEEILKEILNNKYSRVPVYQDDIENIVGVLYVKDLLKYSNQKEFDWQSIIREVKIVPESMLIENLLNDFKSSRVHIAIVVDEFGGLSGLVTLEDILEEIVGNINDEFDNHEEIFYEKLNESNYLINGRLSLSNFYKLINIDGDNFEEYKGDSETIAGFIIENSGKIMVKNEKFKFQNYLFTIEKSNRKKIEKIRLEIKNSDL